MTDNEIIEIAKATNSAEPGRDGYILPISFARAVIAAMAQPVQPAIPFSGADENPPVFARRWKLAVDGFGLQRDDDGNYVHIDDALSVLHAAMKPAPKETK